MPLIAKRPGPERNAPSLGFRQLRAASAAFGGARLATRRLITVAAQARARVALPVRACLS
eukprot:3554871-Alexandrium_andersonii.AAC.1